MNELATGAYLGERYNRYSSGGYDGAMSTSNRAETAVTLEDIMTLMNNETVPLSARVYDAESNARTALSTYEGAAVRIDGIQYELQKLRDAVYGLVENLKRFARVNDIVDENGGSLDDFLSQFVIT